MALPKINMVNQFGEESSNSVLPSSTLPDVSPIAAGTILANLSGSAAVASAQLLQTVSTKLPAKAGVTAISALATPVAAITVTTAGGNTYSDAAINVALASVVADLQTQLTAVNALLAALKAVV